MAIREINTKEFESIVDKYLVRSICIEHIYKLRPDTAFSETDIGIKTHCESNARQLMLLRFTNKGQDPISDPITLTYNPVVSIYRDCLFVKPDDVIQKRLESILDDIGGIKFYFYDVSHPESMIKRFKDNELRIEIVPYDEPTLDYDVVIIFETQDIRGHLKHIEETYKQPYAPMDPITIDVRKKKIVDKYIAGFSYKHLFLIVIFAVVVLSFSLFFGVDDVNTDQLKSIQSPAADASMKSVSPVRLTEISGGNRTFAQAGTNL